jgi:hypothetical protein
MKEGVVGKTIVITQDLELQKKYHVNLSVILYRVHTCILRSVNTTCFQMLNKLALLDESSV